MKKITIVAGTRPEIIKLAPLHTALCNQCSLEFVTTGQHDEMASQALEIFDLTADRNLQLMKSGQTPGGFISVALPALESHLGKAKPDLVIAQGDTASTFATALASFHVQIPFAHVESGLRTGNLDAPFPEEAYRTMISRIAKYHFCPSVRASQALKQEGIVENVHVVGNTVVDALLEIQEQLKTGKAKPSTTIRDYFQRIDQAPLVLVTGHRRENHNRPIEILCESLALVAKEKPETQFIFPVHLNPAVASSVKNLLSGISNIYLCPPLDYVSNIAVLLRADLAISDSGGIQEEAPYCDTFTMVTRQYTERQEVIEQGLGVLLILNSVESVSMRILQALGKRKNVNATPYGDGTTAQKISQILLG